MRRLCRVTVRVLALVLILAHCSEARAAPVTLKIATVMPRGGPWTNALARFAAAVKRRTKGRVVFKMYFGGVAGTERRSVARMRANQLQGLAAAAVGLTSLDKTIRLLELPMLFRSFKEFLYVSKSMHPVYAKRFAKRGYRLLAVAGMGWVHLYSKSRLRSMSEIKGSVHWTWKNDPTAAAFFRALGARSRRLPLSAVLPSLQSNIIDSVYGMPHAVQALQWNTAVSYVLKLRITMSISCLVLRSDGFAKLTPVEQKIVVTEAQILQKRLNTASRAINRKALKTMVTGGLKVQQPAAVLRSRIKALRPKIWRLLRGVTYLPGDLKRVRALLTVCRSTSCSC